MSLDHGDECVRVRAAQLESAIAMKQPVHDPSRRG
jgi:hypothetical protein